MTGLGDDRSHSQFPKSVKKAREKIFETFDFFKGRRRAQMEALNSTDPGGG